MYPFAISYLIQVLHESSFWRYFGDAQRCCRCNRFTVLLCFFCEIRRKAFRFPGPFSSCEWNCILQNPSTSFMKQNPRILWEVKGILECLWVNFEGLSKKTSEEAFPPPPLPFGKSHVTYFILN